MREYHAARSLQPGKDTLEEYNRRRARSEKWELEGRNVAGGKEGGKRGVKAFAIYGMVGITGAVAAYHLFSPSR